MSKKSLCPARKSKKPLTKTDPETLKDLLRGITDPAALLGVDRVTLARWLKGESRAPFAAVQLLRLLNGELPRHFGPWAGWRLDPGGVFVPPGWGEGLHRDDILKLFFWRQQAAHVNNLTAENATLKRDLEFFRGEYERQKRLCFATALMDVLKENSTS